jgi:hypothetical protein
MDSLVSQARLLHQLPVVINVMNIHTPAELATVITAN